MTETTIGTGNPLAHADLAVPPLHIPDGEGGCYKTELVLERSEERVVKIHWWHAADPRRDPHSHPWPFKSTILSGGYTETRYWFDEEADGHISSSQRTYREGDVNDLPLGMFHTVDSVMPGTVTRMECGPLVEGGDWGYLIDDAYVSVKDADRDPNFLKHLRDLNPHKRSDDYRLGSDGTPDIEMLAAVEHKSWGGWTKWMLSQIRKQMAPVDRGAFEELLCVQRWRRQMNTPYADLSEKEKESDRKEVREKLKVYRPGTVKA